MTRGMKWALLLFLFAGAFLMTAQAQPNAAGTTNLEYDPQSNTLIATCTESADYSTEASYLDITTCEIQTTNPAQYVAAAFGEEEAQVEFPNPSPGVSYTAWGYYEVLGIYITYYYQAPLGYGYYFYDPFDYDYYDDADYVYTGDYGDWPGFEYAVYVSGADLLGYVYSNPVTTDDPTYAVVMSDDTGQAPSGVEERVTTYQVHNANGSIAASIPVGENFSATGWSCTNGGQPATLTTSCSAPYVTDSNGQYPDTWTYYGTYYTPAGCGANIVDHWQWCPVPQTFMTLTGWIHTTSSDINGYVNPPSATAIPIGTAFGP